MTLEDMTEVLRAGASHPESRMDTDEADIIITALRAGQSMRDRIYAFNVADGSDDINHKPSRSEAQWDMCAAMRQWDAATGEKE